MFYNYEGVTLEPYSKAPLEVLHHKDVKDFSKLLYFELYSIYDQNKNNSDHLFIKDETLAEKFDVSIRYVKQGIKDLEDNELIKRKTSAYDKHRESKKRKIYLRYLKRNTDNTVRYVMFPKSIYEKTDISNLSKIILIELMSLLEVDDFESESYGTIHIARLADNIGKHRRTVLNNLNQLANQRYISLEGSGSKRIIRLEKEAVFNSGMYL